MNDQQSRPIVANQTRKRDDPPWTAADVANGYDRWRQEHEAWKATAKPVVVVGIEDGAIVRAFLIVTAIWFVLGAIGVGLLFALGVL